MFFIVHLNKNIITPALFFYFTVHFFLCHTNIINAQNIRAVDSLNGLSWNICFNYPDSSKKIVIEALNAAQEINYKKGEAESQAKMAVLYDITGEPERALPLFLNAIKTQESIKDSSGLSFSYNNLGLMYYAQYDYKNALTFLKRSLKIDQKRNDKKGAAGAFVNIGIIYTYLDSLDLALKLYNNAKNIYLETKDTAGLMSCYSNIAKIFFQRSEYSKALEYHKKNELFLLNNPNVERLSSSYNSIANIYLKLKNYSEAKKYAFKDLEICEKHLLLNRKQFAYETLNEIFFETNDFQKAHDYLKKYTSLRDSLLNENRNATIAEMQTKYETEKKENEILKINAEKENEISKNKTQKIILVAISFISIIIIAFFFWANLSKKKINKLLEDKNKLDQAIIKQKEIMMGEVHHRVKNNLQLISSIIELQMKSTDNDMVVLSIQDIQKRVESIALLHQFLYQSENVEKVEIGTYIIEVTSGLKKTFLTPEKQINFEYSLPEMWVDLNTAVPLGLIINELVTNSFKHAFKHKKEGAIVIQLENKNNVLHLLVADNGFGETNDKVSFGLKMIKSLCRQLNATWTSRFNNGLENKFEIKKFKVYE